MAKLDYENRGGYVGRMLEDFLRRKNPIHWIRIALTYPKSSSWTELYSEGDFRLDALESARCLVGMDQEDGEDMGYSTGRSKKGLLPIDWEQQILTAEGPTMEIRGTEGLALKIGTLNMKRVAEIAQGGSVLNLRRDEADRQILSREDLLVEFRGYIADQLMNSNRFGDPTKMWQAPDEDELQRMVEGAGRTYDHYMSIPVGALMVTKGFIFPYVIGRKEFPDLRWTDGRHCGQSYKGARIPTADTCVHLTGIDKDCAPHMMRNPVFRADFSFPMDVITETFEVPRCEEGDYVERAVESMGEFASIWVQNPNYGIINQQSMTPNRGYHWHPTRDELIRACKLHVRIGG